MRSVWHATVLEEINTTLKSKEDLCEISMRMGRCVTSVVRCPHCRYDVRHRDEVAVGLWTIIGVSASPQSPKAGIGKKVWNARAWRFVAPRSKIWVRHLICTSADCHLHESMTLHSHVRRLTAGPVGCRTFLKGERGRFVGR